MFNIFKSWNTLRNQLLVVYLFVTLLVLIIVSGITYVLVADLLQENAEEQIRQTAIESSGRYDSLYEQINMVTKQIITNEELQNILLKEWNGYSSTFNERQSLMSSVNLIQANADGIYSVEVYTSDYQRIIPIDATNLVERLDPKWVSQANKAKGGLIWIGEDPLDSNYFLVGRRINLFEENFEHGGYVVVRISRPHFQLNNEATTDYTILLDDKKKTIATNFPYEIENITGSADEILLVDEKEYMVVQHTSDITGWTIYYLTPVEQLTKGMPTVLIGIIIAGIVGLLIFFVSSFFLATFITRPITRLTKTMREAGKGVLAHNPEILSTNEINELNQTYNQLAAETNYLVQMVYEKEIMKNRTELKALQAQIHPHFLFNTLDALYWSLDEKDEEELANVVLAMSELFRYTITKENQDEWVTIKEELEHIERYMKIMRMRFGNRLNWEKEVDFDWLHAKIPKLMIQPLVENAILHGAGNVVRQSNITVLIEKVVDCDHIRIAITDNGPGMNPDRLGYVKKLMNGDVAEQKGSGMALQNVQKRLRLFYGDKASSLHIHSVEEKGTMVSFKIPIKDLW
ncbi:two-component system, sensor histidine kinase YesM [Gracilibacillus ureilyticus]|uniref:histidine kinase n=1 Tax=Gracilibacillus ureilyticus TaxID=531814 RepID=A0A1H9N2A3_9BACI|nr:histidine kinase [Gracilibacillus ureilyticus]SER29513.1 two-component system, sensor histidine kinase YesM [Gracilibacillus ureilyticus]